MERVFYFFRHGETNWNAQGRIQGSTDIPLNDKGREQARALAENIAKLKVEAIWTSDLMRAKETGEIVASALGIPMREDRRLRECHYGEAEGMHSEDIRKKFGEDLWHKLRHPGNFDCGFPNGETKQEVVNRVMESLREIKTITDNRIMAISTHGGVVRNLIFQILGDKMEKVPIPNGVVYKFICFDSGSTNLNWKVEGPIEF